MKFYVRVMTLHFRRNNVKWFYQLFFFFLPVGIDTHIVAGENQRLC